MAKKDADHDTISDCDIQSQFSKVNKIENKQKLLPIKRQAEEPE
jgi:hypothetical protein